MKMPMLCSLIVAALALPTMADIIYPDGHAPAPEPYQIRKIGRGISNIVLAPLEIPKAVFDIGRDEGVLASQQFGIGAFTRGPYNAGIRLSQGVYETFFWQPGNEKTLHHLAPEQLKLTDVIPGFESQFDWESIDTAAHTFQSTPLSSWHQ